MGAFDLSQLPDLFAQRRVEILADATKSASRPIDAAVSPFQRHGHLGRGRLDRVESQSQTGGRRYVRGRIVRDARDRMGRDSLGRGKGERERGRDLLAGSAQVFYLPPALVLDLGLIHQRRTGAGESAATILVDRRDGTPNPVERIGLRTEPAYPSDQAAHTP